MRFSREDKSLFFGAVSFAIVSLFLYTVIKLDFSFSIVLGIAVGILVGILYSEVSK